MRGPTGSGRLRQGPSGLDEAGGAGSAAGASLLSLQAAAGRRPGSGKDDHQAQVGRREELGGGRRSRGRVHGGIFREFNNNPRTVDIDALLACLGHVPYPSTLDTMLQPVASRRATAAPSSTPAGAPAALAFAGRRGVVGGRGARASGPRASQRAPPPPEPGHPVVSKLELRAAVGMLKLGKAADADEMVAELIKAGGDLALEMWADILTVMMQRPEERPTSWATANITGLYKGKGTRGETINHRPISISTLRYKLLSLVLLCRFRHKLGPQLMDEQFGFRRRRGVDDCVFSLKRLQEEFQHNDRRLYLAFLDLAKAYDSVPREALFRVLQERYGIDEGAMRVLCAMYTDMQGQVKVGAASSAPFPISRGCGRASCSCRSFLRCTWTSSSDRRPRSAARWASSGRTRAVRWSG